MKPGLRYIFTGMICLFQMHSCIMGPTAGDIEEVVGKGEKGTESKSEPLKSGTLALFIENCAPNTSLQVDSIEICNIMLKDDECDLLEKGNKMMADYPDKTTVGYRNSLLLPKIEIPVQTFVQWTPEKLPQRDTGMYIKIYGNMYTCIANNTLFLLCSGPFYFSFYGSISENSTTEKKYAIKENGNLYCIIEDKAEKVLQTIKFNVSVDGWIQVYN